MFSIIKKATVLRKLVEWGNGGRESARMDTK